MAPTNRDRLDALEKAVFASQAATQVPADDAKKRSRIAEWLWAERSWLIPTVVAMALVIIPGSFGVAYYVAGLEFDKHFDTKFAPAVAPIKDEISGLRQEVHQLSGDVHELRGMFSVLQAPKVVSKYSQLPPKELQAHAEELRKIKSELAAAPKDTPNLWPVGFQIINLFSRARFEAEMAEVAHQPAEVLLGDVRFGPGTMEPIKNRKVFLHGDIEGVTLINCIVRFDPSIRLANDTFVNCIFVFPPDANPSRPLQEIGATLLASDLSHVVLNVS